MVKDRCAALADNGQRCLRTKDLTNCLITIQREGEQAKILLPAQAVVRLCPGHLRLSQLDSFLAGLPRRKDASSKNE